MKYRIPSLVFGLGLFLSVLAMPAKADVGMAFGIKGYMSTFDTSGTEEEGYGAPKGNIDFKLSNFDK